MNRRIKYASVLVIVLLVISLSLNIVSAVNQSPVPGSDEDPIVSKSYVDAAVNELSTKIQLLLDQNDALKTKVANQDQIIKTLQNEINALKSGKPGDPGAGNSGGTPADNPPETPDTSIKATVNVAVLNLRSQPSTSSSILGKLYRNGTVTVVSESAGWSKVITADGKNGYVFSIYITKKK